MLGIALLGADLALFLITVIVVGNRPTSAKVAAIICLVWIVDYGFICVTAFLDHMNPIAWYQQLLEEAMSVYSMLLGGKPDGIEATVAVVAGVSPAIYMVQSASYVFIGLCIRWVVDRVRGKSGWSAFSRVDLSIWWLAPLLLGVSCYTVALFLPQQASQIVWLVSMNVLVVSAIPLFVQGAAVGKGIMDRAGLGLAWQIILGVLLIVSGFAFLIVPVLGLIDFWANFRRLPRGEGSPQEQAAK